MKKRIIAGLLAIVAGATLIGINTVTAGSGPNPPSAPPWVDADGTIDTSKLPELVPVVGPDGELLLDPEGNPVLEDPRAPDFGPPPAPPPPDVELPLPNRGEGGESHRGD